MTTTTTTEDTTLCACGCGETTTIRRGKHQKFLRGHYRKSIRNKLTPRLCACGCGRVTKIRRGKYNKFIHTHHRTKNKATSIDICKLKQRCKKITALTNSPFIGERDVAIKKSNELKLLIKEHNKNNKPKSNKINTDDWRDLDMIIRDFEFYGYRYVVPAKRLTWGSNNKNLLT